MKFIKVTACHVNTFFVINTLQIVFLNLYKALKKAVDLTKKYFAAMVIWFFTQFRSSYEAFRLADITSIFLNFKRRNDWIPSGEGYKVL